MFRYNTYHLIFLKRDKPLGSFGWLSKQQEAVFALTSSDLFNIAVIGFAIFFVVVFIDLLLLYSYNLHYKPVLVIRSTASFLQVIEIVNRIIRCFLLEKKVFGTKGRSDVVFGCYDEK